MSEGDDRAEAQVKQAVAAEILLLILYRVIHETLHYLKEVL